MCLCSEAESSPGATGRAVATSLWQGRVHLHLVVWWRRAGQGKGWLHCNGVATWLWTSWSPEDEIVYKGSFLAVAALGHQMGRLARVRSAVISRVRACTHACLLGSAATSCSGDCALAEGLWDSSVPSALAQRCHVPVSRAGAAPQQRGGSAELGVVAAAIASLSTRGRFVCFQGCCNPGAGFLGMIAYQKGCNCVRVQDV